MLFSKLIENGPVLCCSSCFVSFTWIQKSLPFIDIKNADRLQQMEVMKCCIIQILL